MARKSHTRKSGGPSGRQKFGDPRKREGAVRPWAVSGGDLQLWLDKLEAITVDGARAFALIECFDSCNQLLEGLGRLQKCRDEVDKLSGGGEANEEGKQRIFQATESWFNAFHLALSSFAAALHAHPEVFGDVPTRSMSKFVDWLERRFPLGLPTDFLRISLRFRSMLDHPAMHQSYEWGVAFSDTSETRVFLYGDPSRSGTIPEGSAFNRSLMPTKWTFVAPDETWTTDSLGLLLMTATMQVVEPRVNGQPVIPRFRQTFVGKSYSVDTNFTILVPQRAVLSTRRTTMRFVSGAFDKLVSQSPSKSRAPFFNVSGVSGLDENGVPKRVPVILTAEWMKLLEGMLMKAHDTGAMDEKAFQSIGPFFDATYRLIRKRDELAALRDAIGLDGVNPVSEENRQIFAAATKAWFQSFYAALSAFSAMIARHSKLFGADLPATEISQFLPWLSSVLPVGTPIDPLESGRRFRTVLNHPEQLLPFQSTVEGTAESLRLVVQGTSSRAKPLPEGSTPIANSANGNWVFTAPDEDWLLDSLGLIVFMCLSTISASATPLEYLPDRVEVSPAVTSIFIEATGNVIVPAIPTSRW